MRRLTASIFACGILLSCVCLVAVARADDFAGLCLNQIQVIGSHNSYKSALDPGLLEIVAGFSQEQARTLEYSHIPVRDQLDLGLRALEFDVFYDPEGGRYADPAGRRLQQAAGKAMLPYDRTPMRGPGFKVLHSQDIDFRSHCPLLRDAYRELRQWSEAHPGHLPVFVTFNAKSGPSVVPGGVAALPFNEAAFAEWDALALAELGHDRVITPDMVRGTADSLEAAILTRGWPALDACRGKFLLVLDETGSAHDTYLTRHPSLTGRPMFTTSPPGTSSAAVLIINDPIAGEAEIERRVKQGYLVRTRADADTWEARRMDFSRFKAAKRSGAQLISTDYYLPDVRISPGYVVNFGPGVYERANPLIGN